MRLTKMGHACVRLEHAGATLIIDPGSFSAPDAADGADAILITHEHADHFVEERVRAAAERNPDLHIWTNSAVANLLASSQPSLGTRVQSVQHGDTFSAAGMDVLVIGELHALVHPDVPRVLNVGFLVGGQVFHPGDAFTLPQQPVETLLLPIHAPWSKAAEVIDFARAVKPRLAVPIHDALLSDLGLGLIDRLLGPNGPGIGADYRRLNAGQSLEF
jgi:L-ascorbate metabolism protein UlaG (beta-lactamase superfamily)